MIITIFVPEILVGKAFCDWRASKDFPNQSGDHKPGWNVLHDPKGVHLANMGYFVLQWDQEPPAPSTDSEPADVSAERDEELGDNTASEVNKGFGFRRRLLNTSN